MTKLTDTQLIILGKACERPDGAVYPLTIKLKGGAVTKVLSSLITKGLCSRRSAPSATRQSGVATKRTGRSPFTPPEPPTRR